MTFDTTTLAVSVNLLEVLLESLPRPLLVRAREFDVI